VQWTCPRCDVTGLGSDRGGRPVAEGRFRVMLVAYLSWLRIQRRRPTMRTRCLPYLGALLMVAGCAAPSLMPPSQAAAVKNRERALGAHADAIHAAIKGSGQPGALADR